jgi:hypothetical protein
MTSESSTIAYTLDQNGFDAQLFDLPSSAVLSSTLEHFRIVGRNYRRFSMALRRAFALIGALVLAAGTPAVSHAQDNTRDQKAQEQRKLTKDEQKEYEELHKIVEAVVAGKQPAPADVKIKFQNYFMRAATEVYVPYVLEVSGGKFTSFPVAMYVRVVKKTADAAPAPAAKQEGNKPPAAAEPAFADVAFLNEKNIVAAKAADGTEVLEISRAVVLAPGNYDVIVTLREKASRDRKAAPPKAVVSTHALTVPDLANGLTTSSLILATALDAAPQQLTGQQQLEQPFVFSGYKVAPRFNTSLTKSEELLFVFFIYNEGVAASGKPDLDVEYNFFRAAEEKPFTKLASQAFNSTTLPGEFNVNSGHQVFVGQGVPLNNPQVPFAAGDYRLEIKITDKIKGQTITRNVPFTVMP